MRTTIRVVRIRGDAVLSAGSVGQGVLLVDGSLRVDAGARFAGVVIAGNDIEVRGAGAEITGVVFAKRSRPSRWVDHCGRRRGAIRALRGAARGTRCGASGADAGPLVGGAALTREAPCGHDADA